MSREYILGGAQFGNGYGKFIKVPKLSSYEITSLLEYSKVMGVSLIDIAQSYTGCVSNLSQVSISKDFDFSTKILYGMNSEQECENDLVRDLELLSKAKYHSILIHNWSNLDFETKLDSLKFLSRLKSNQLTSKIGISVYEPDELDPLPISLDIIQAPLNFFNISFLESRSAYSLRQQGVEFACRSIFHQGLLLNADSNLLLRFPELLEFEEFCDVKKISRVQGALSIYDSQNLFSHLVVGVQSAMQLQIISDTDIYKSDLSLLTRRNYRKDFIDPRIW
jgi:aryl-alcohol dehydrogenase-like predicted oxidoreductase